MLDPAGEQPAGLHHLVPGVVDGRRRVIDGADQRHLVHHRRQPGEDLGDLDARHLGRDRPERPADLLGRIGLHVPGVELRRAADQEQQDAVEVAIRRDGPGIRQGLHRRQAQAQCRQRPGVEEIAAGQAVAEVDRLPGIDSEHRATPLDSARGGNGGQGRSGHVQASILIASIGRVKQAPGIRWPATSIGSGLLDLVLLPREFAASIFADDVSRLSPLKPGCKHAFGSRLASFHRIRARWLPGLASFRRFPYRREMESTWNETKCKHHRTGMASFL